MEGRGTYATAGGGAVAIRVTKPQAGDPDSETQSAASVLGMQAKTSVTLLT